MDELVTRLAFPCGDAENGGEKAFSDEICDALVDGERKQGEWGHGEEMKLVNEISGMSTFTSAEARNKLFIDLEALREFYDGLLNQKELLMRAMKGTQLGQTISVPRALHKSFFNLLEICSEQAKSFDTEFQKMQELLGSTDVHIFDETVKKVEDLLLILRNRIADMHRIRAS